MSAVTAAGETHPGLQREVNEDRFHVDIPRGLFIVVDGIGGQAAGGKAADVAMRMLRTRLERETARSAIAFARRSPSPTTKSGALRSCGRNGTAWRAC